MDGKSQDTIETRLYCITFLLIDGYKDCNWNCIWVMGKVVKIVSFVAMLAVNRTTGVLYLTLIQVLQRRE